MQLRRSRRIALVIGAVGLSTASVAVADLIGVDVKNDVNGTVQGSATYTRAQLPVEDSSYWWIEPKDGDRVNGCNADAANPVTLTVTATPSNLEFFDGSQYVSAPATTQRSQCDLPSDGETPATASEVRYRLPATMSLGRTSLRGHGSGGKTDDQGRHGTFTSRTVVINIMPRNPGAMSATTAGAGAAELTWPQSPDHADLTGYEIRRRTGDTAYAGWSEPLDETVETSYVATDLAPSTTYCFQVRAVFRQDVGGGTIVTFPSGQSIEDCVTTPTNALPGVPGTPRLADGSSSPNGDGVMKLTWDGTTDPDGDPITYALQHRDADDADWETVGTTTERSYSFQSFAPEAEGTWRYRVQAADGLAGGPFSGESEPVTVDKSAPHDPTAAAPGADYTGGDGTEWHRDEATVRFSRSPATANGDRDLTDGSAGSGVASVSDPLTFSVSGQHVATGKVIDRVGLASGEVSRTVQVDADPPTAVLSGCPSDGSSPAMVKAGTAIALKVSGADADSGLRALTVTQTGHGSSEAASGATVAMDTSRTGRHTVTLVATDNVAGSAADERHIAQQSCTVLIHSRMIQVSCGRQSLDIDTSTTSLTRWAGWWLTVSRWIRSCGWVTVRLPDGREYRIDFDLIRHFMTRR